MKPSVITTIVALYAAHGEAGVQKPAEPRIVQECRNLWAKEIPEDIRVLLGAMIRQADSGAIVRADLDECQPLRALQDNERIALERLLALRDQRIVTFSTQMVVVHPPRRFEEARASENNKYSLGQPKKSRPSRNVRH
jgi:hypothetical protein